MFKTLRKETEVLYQFHPKVFLITQILDYVAIALVGAAVTLAICHKTGILALTTDDAEILVHGAIIIAACVWLTPIMVTLWVNMFFDKRYITDYLFMIIDRSPFQLDYNYMDFLLGRLKEICGEATVRAVYAYGTPKEKEDATTPLSTDYRDTWTNNPGRKILEVRFESTGNEAADNPSCLKLCYRRPPHPFFSQYSRLYVEGTGFSENKREEIIDLITREQWRTRPKYNLVVNAGPGFVAVVGSIIIILFLGPAESYGFIAGVVITVVVTLLLMAALFAKYTLFPTGTFKIDAETEEIEQRELLQGRILNSVGKTLRGFLYILGIKFI